MLFGRRSFQTDILAGKLRPKLLLCEEKGTSPVCINVWFIYWTLTIFHSALDFPLSYLHVQCLPRDIFFLQGCCNGGHILQVMAKGADWRTARGCWEATCCWHHLAEACAQSFPSSYQTSALYEITDDLLFLQLICSWFPLAPNNKWDEEPSSAWKCMALSLLPICPLGIKMAVWWKLKHSLENISGLSKFILSFLFLPCFCLVRSQHTFVLP